MIRVKLVHRSPLLPTQNSRLPSHQLRDMQVTTYLRPTLFPVAIANKTSARTSANTRSRFSASMKAKAAMVDYSSMTSVFPVDACETIGGDTCNVEMFPEARLEPEPRTGKNGRNISGESVEREYLEYDSPKTVFPGEACDDLGGEFCNAEYQKGVY